MDFTIAGPWILLILVTLIGGGFWIDSRRKQKSPEQLEYEAEVKAAYKRGEPWPKTGRGSGEQR